VVITQRFIPLAEAVMTGRARPEHPRVVLPPGTDLAPQAELAAMADQIIGELFVPPETPR
jgi:hypothetical protein